MILKVHTIDFDQLMVNYTLMTDDGSTTLAGPATAFFPAEALTFNQIRTAIRPQVRALAISVRQQHTSAASALANAESDPLT